VSLELQSITHIISRDTLYFISAVSVVVVVMQSQCRILHSF